MTKENVSQIFDEVLYGSLNVQSVHIFTRFQVVNLDKDANGKFPAFTLSDTMLYLEHNGYPRYQWVSLEGIDLITAE